MRGISKLVVTAATAVALTGGGLAAANLASAAPGDKTGFCKTTEHYAYHHNSTGQRVRCLPPSGKGTTWEWTDVSHGPMPPPSATPTHPTPVPTHPTAPLAVATTKRPHFTG